MPQGCAKKIQFHLLAANRALQLGHPLLRVCWRLRRWLIRHRTLGRTCP
jgi:hypothetical protein